MFYNNRGVIQGILKNYQQAIVEFDHAIELDATNGEFFYRRGQAYYEFKNFQQAIIDFNRAMKLDTDLEYEGQRSKGKALHSLGRFQEAISAFHKALVASPGHTECVIWLAKSYMAVHSSGGISSSQTENSTMRSVDFEEVLDYFNRTVKFNPTDTKALFTRGETYSLMGYHKEALTDFDRVIALNKSINIHFNKTIDRHLNRARALVLSYLKRYTEAIEGYEQILKEEPNDEVYLYNLVVAMARERGIAESQTIIDKAYAGLQKIRRTEMGHVKLYGLGGLEALMSNIDQALDYLEAALPLSEEILYWARYDAAWLDLDNNIRFQTLIFEGNNLGNVP